MGHSPWGHKETDMTEVTEHARTCKINVHSQNKINIDPLDSNKIILLKPTLLVLYSLHFTLLPPSLIPAHPAKYYLPDGVYQYLVALVSIRA